MRSRFRCPGVLVLARVAAFAAISPMAGQSISDRTLWIHKADVSNREPAVIVLSALQFNWRANQEPIMGVVPLEIKSDTFEVFVDKHRVQLAKAQKFADSPEGIDVVLAIDVSGPAYAQFARLRDAVKSFVRRLRPGKDRVAILTFGADSKVSEFRVHDEYSPSTDDIQALESALTEPPEREMKANTVLYKGLTEAIALAGRGRFSQPVAAERVVVVLSDGHDEGIGYDIGNPIGTAKQHGVPVFGLGLPEPSTGNRYHDVLDRIAKESGGVFVPVRDAARLTEVYEKLDTLLKAQYVLTVQIPTDIQDGREHTLQVVAMHDGVPLSARSDVRTQIRPPVPAAVTTGTNAPADPAGPPHQSKSWWERYRYWLWGFTALAVVMALGWGGWRWWRLRWQYVDPDDDGSMVV